MNDRTGLSKGDRNRNARLARLRELLPLDNAIVGIDLAPAAPGHSARRGDAPDGRAPGRGASPAARIQDETYLVLRDPEIYLDWARGVAAKEAVTCTARSCMTRSEPLTP